MKKIDKKYLDTALSYADYRRMSRSELGEAHQRELNYPEELRAYVEMNERRMDRWDRKLPELLGKNADISGIGGDYAMLVLTEAWCGDAAHVVPVAEYLSKLAGIKTGYLFRDQNLELMDAFLTNGGRSIPKLILINKDTLDVLGSWGPRPGELQDWYWKQKEEGKLSKDEVLAQIQLWYNRDKARSTGAELVDWISSTSLKSQPGHAF